MEVSQWWRSLEVSNSLIWRKVGRGWGSRRPSDIDVASCRLAVRHSEINDQHSVRDYRSLIYSGIIAPLTFAIQLQAWMCLNEGGGGLCVCGGVVGEE